MSRPVAERRDLVLADRRHSIPPERSHFVRLSLAAASLHAMTLASGSIAAQSRRSSPAPACHPPPAHHCSRALFRNSAILSWVDQGSLAFLPPSSPAPASPPVLISPAPGRSAIQSSLKLPARATHALVSMVRNSVPSSNSPSAIAATTFSALIRNPISQADPATALYSQDLVGKSPSPCIHISPSSDFARIIPFRLGTHIVGQPCCFDPASGNIAILERDAQGFSAIQAFTPGSKQFRIPNDPDQNSARSLA